MRALYGLLFLPLSHSPYDRLVDCSGNTFGKNELVKKVFWTLFISMAGLVLARVVDPVTAQLIVGMITGMRYQKVDGCDG